MKSNFTAKYVKAFTSFYDDPTIGYHLESRRDACPGSIMVRQGITDALNNQAPNQEIKDHYMRQFYSLGYIKGSDARYDYDRDFRRGYEDWYAGFDMIEEGYAYRAGYRDAMDDDVDYQRGQEEIFLGDICYSH
ncbi:hypothetical protein [Roseofilum capinflatum]|uniref:Uncharacterized protein n=1 Tax=Roseofilum capinflatum BLCC-M114 TaxID=3022440 RepID=A0ABT7B6T7_9CYAN|nr:hypothetical protein [Roseofilum capinflatum]MDJ1174882.1 hypothetical protein [Roseofilum capinflatum BLCC-M114]